MGKYIELTNGDFDSTVKEGVSLVDFWAPWCGPCRAIGPIIEELAEEFDGKAKVCKVNVDDEQDLAMKFGVRSIPTIIIMKDGEKIDTLVGAGSIDALRDAINKQL